MYQLSCDISLFASQSLECGLDAADALQINNVELANLNGKPLEQCNGNQIEDARCALLDHNKRIVLWTSRIPVSDADGFNELFRRAHLLGVETVRVPLGSRSPEPKDTACLIKMADAWDIGVAFENDRASFFRDNPSMTEFMRELPDSACLIFDPAELVALSHHPFFHVFYVSRLKNRIRFLRLNDALYSTGEPMRLAEGNSEIKELISILLSRSFSGYFSVTPYREVGVEAMAETLDEFRCLMKNL